MATHSSILAGEFLGQECGGLQVHGVTKSQTWLNETHTHTFYSCADSTLFKNCTFLE